MRVTKIEKLHITPYFLHNSFVILLLFMMERNRKVSTYKAILRKFMSYRDEVEYGSSETFTVEQLSSVTATDVANYFLYRCYGTADPEESAVPVQRSNSVKY